MDLQPQSDGTPDGRPRLAAVVFTDVVGYSARMQRDEAGTIAGVQADFERLRAHCAACGGEVLNTMGDGMMLSFPSAVQAVSFAVRAQDEFAARNAALPADQGLAHRIGVHLGDVFRSAGGQLAGDGVNIAARLEGKAPVGGICISQTVYDTVKGKLPLRASFAGQQSFKNIAEPIPVWHLLPAGVAAPADSPPSAAAVAAGPARMPRRRWLVAGGSGLALALAAGGVYWSRRGDGAAVAGGQAKSIAVLPFVSMSPDKDASYFADGMHEDLLTQLALLGELKVVSRTSVMEYRNSGKNMRQIGNELGVASLVEGSVRRAGNLVRVTAQLIDARSDQHLWAQNYDRELKDIFAVQSELATEIARALKVSLSPGEQARLARRPTDNLEAYDLFLRHQELVNQSGGSVRTVSTVNERVELLEKAVALDPKFALAWARLAAEHGRARGYGIDPTDARQGRARRAMAQALALAPDDPQVKIEEGAFQLHALDDPARAAAAYQSVLAQAPNNVAALHGLAEVYNEQLRMPQAIGLLEQALTVDARHSSSLGRLGSYYLRFRHYDRSQALREQLIALRPDDMDARANYYLNEYWRTGSWAGYDKWRATLPAGAERRFTRVRNTDADRAIARRDFAEVHRLNDLDAEDWKGGPVDLVSLSAWHVLIDHAAGDASRAAAGARAALARIDAALAKERGNEMLWQARAFMNALRGARAEAFADLDKAVAAMQGGNQFIIESMRRRSLDVLALLGEREQALQELRRQVRLPGCWIHDLAVNLNLASLWNDPQFVAIVQDPASNAPLPLDTPVVGGQGR